MPLEHAHKPGRFDPGHCRDCAHETDLLDHYWHVQRQEQAFKSTQRWARRAHRFATWALWLSGSSILLAVNALGALLLALSIGQVRGPARTQPVLHAAGTNGAATHGGGVGHGRGPGRVGP